MNDPLLQASKYTGIKDPLMQATKGERQRGIPAQTPTAAPKSTMPQVSGAEGAAEQMKKYDAYTGQAMGGSAAEAMQLANQAAAQQAQGVSDQAIQQAIKAGKTSGAMGGQAALAAAGQAANAYGQAQQAGQQQYFNTTQLGAQLGSEMASRQRQKYETDVGAQVSREATAANAAAAAAANKTNKRGQNIGLAGNIIGGLGGIAALFSDERLKEGIRPASMTDGLDKIRAYTYKYKQGPAYAGGRKESGVMAQDLEKTVMAPAVMDTPEGKKIDTARLSTMNTGAIAEQQRKIDSIVDYLKNMKRPEAK